MVAMEGREWTEGQIHKGEEWEGWCGTGEEPGALGYGGRAVYICAGVR